MIRTVSPCCQSGGEKTSAQGTPMASTSAASAQRTGVARSVRRRKRPGWAKRCQPAARRAGSGAGAGAWAGAGVGAEEALTPPLYALGPMD